MTTLLDRITKATAEREAPRCVLCGSTATAHGTAHAFRAERPVRFAAKDLTWGKAA